MSTPSSPAAPSLEALPADRDAVDPGRSRTPLAMVALTYLGLFLLITWPLALHPSTQVVSNNGDGFFDMLLFWYARRGQMLAPHVDSLFYPLGVALGREKLYWLVPLMSVPLQTIMPLPAAFNVLMAGFFTATATATWLLAREQGATTAGAFLAGLLIVTSPAYLNEMSQGIPETMALQWPILFVLFGLRAAGENGGRARVLSVVFFVLSWLTSWYLGLLAVLVLPFLPLRRLAMPLAVAVPVVLITILPFTNVARDRSGGAGFSAEKVANMGDQTTPPRLPTLEGGDLLRVDEQEWSTQDTFSVLRNSSDLSGFFARYRPWRMRDVLPGALLVMLAVVGLARRKRGTLPWGAIAAGCTLLSLGPQLLWNGVPVCSTPLALLYRSMPALSHIRPVRFQLGVALALAIAASFTLPRFRSRVPSFALLALLVGCQFVESEVVYQTHYRVDPYSARVPAGYEALRGEGPLIDYPLIPNGLATGQHLYAQTVHQNPMLNYDFVTSTSARRLQRLAQENSLIAAILRGSGEVKQPDTEAVAAEGFRSLVLHTRVPQALPDLAAQLFSSPLAGSTFFAQPAFETPLFTTDLFEKLRKIYGEPRPLAGGLLVFDLSAPSRTVWKSDGTLNEDLRWMPYQGEGPVRTLQPVAIGPISPRDVPCEVRGWVRGRGARVTVRGLQGDVLMGESAIEDDWTWIRLVVTTLGTAPRLEVHIEPGEDQDAESAGFGLLLTHNRAKPVP